MVTIFTPASGKELAPHVGQTGIKIHAEIATSSNWFDLTAATRKEIILQNPTGTKKALAASRVGPNDTTGTTKTFDDHLGNNISYDVQLEVNITDTGTLDESGTWKVWAEVDQGGSNFIGKATEFQVYAVGEI